MSELFEKACVPCRGGVAPLTPQQIAPLLEQLDGWSVIENHHLSKTYKFPDFATALDMVNRVGLVAENEGHHPDIALSWGEVRLDLFTHKINGLTESDFILAAKADRCFSPDGIG